METTGSDATAVSDPRQPGIVVATRPVTRTGLGAWPVASAALALVAFGLGSALTAPAATSVRAESVSPTPTPIATRAGAPVAPSRPIVTVDAGGVVTTSIVVGRPGTVLASVWVGDRQIATSHIPAARSGSLTVAVPAPPPRFDLAARLRVIGPDGVPLIDAPFDLPAASVSRLRWIRPVVDAAGLDALAVSVDVPAAARRVVMGFEDAAGRRPALTPAAVGTGESWGGLLTPTIEATALLRPTGLVPSAVTTLVASWEDASGRHALRWTFVVPDPARGADGVDARP